MELPKNYNPQEAEPRLIEFWEKEKIFAFDPKSKTEIYSIDTPPPTKSPTCSACPSIKFKSGHFAK